MNKKFIWISFFIRKVLITAVWILHCFKMRLQRCLFTFKLFIQKMLTKQPTSFSTVLQRLIICMPQVRSLLTVNLFRHVFEFLWHVALFNSHKIRHLHAKHLNYLKESPGTALLAFAFLGDVVGTMVAPTISEDLPHFLQRLRLRKLFFQRLNKFCWYFLGAMKNTCCYNYSWDCIECELKIINCMKWYKMYFIVVETHR